MWIDIEKLNKSKMLPKKQNKINHIFLNSNALLYFLQRLH